MPLYGYRVFRKKKKKKKRRHQTWKVEVRKAEFLAAHRKCKATPGYKERIVDSSGFSAEDPPFRAIHTKIITKTSMSRPPA